MAEDVFGIVGSVIASAYHVESVVAEGQSGVLYRGHHAGSRAPLSLELLRVPKQNPEQQAAFLQLFRREGELLVRLSQSLPSVVRVLHVDAFTSKLGGFAPYWVQEWLDGVTFEALVQQRRHANLAPIPLRKLIRLLTPVARALECVHDFRGPDGKVSLVHGELKPDNLLITQVADQELVKISDFGLGKLRRMASQGADGLGEESHARLPLSPGYGAPEQWAPRNYGQTGPWTDVWGLARCLTEVMAARSMVEGDPATLMAIALDPKRRPTPRNEGIELPDALEAVFERALAVDPRARQRHVGVFWNELLAALDQPEPLAHARGLEKAEELEFDPTSVRRPGPSLPVSAPYSLTPSAPLRPPAAARPPALTSMPAPRATAASGATALHFVPDLELAPPSVARRPSGERPVAQPTAAPSSGLDLDLASLPVAHDLALDLDLPDDEPRARRGASSQGLLAVRPSEPPSSSPPSRRPSSLPASVPAAGHSPSGSPESASVSTRNANAGLPANVLESPRAPRSSRAPASADVSAQLEASFVAKIELRSAQERSFVQRLRPAMALFAGAILVAAVDPLYAAATGEVLVLAGQRLSRLAGALLFLALVLAGREVLREPVVDR